MAKGTNESLDVSLAETVISVLAVSNPSRGCIRWVEIDKVVSRHVIEAICEIHGSKVRISEGYRAAIECCFIRYLPRVLAAGHIELPLAVCAIDPIKAETIQVDEPGRSIDQRQIGG